MLSYPMQLKMELKGEPEIIEEKSVEIVKENMNLKNEIVHQKLENKEIKKIAFKQIKI